MKVANALSNNQPNMKDVINCTIRAVCSDIKNYAENPEIGFCQNKKASSEHPYTVYP